MISLETSLLYFFFQESRSIIFITFFKNMAVKFEEYRQRFNGKAAEISAGPVEKRQCTDICCIIFFFLIFFATVGFGAYLINAGKSDIGELVSSTGSAAMSFGKVMAKFPGPIIGMLVLSNALSVIFILLSKQFPKCMFYSLMVLTFLVYLAIIILGFVIKSYALSIIFIIILLINICILYCYWDYIQIGLKIIACAARFLTEKPAVYAISGLCLLINVLYTILWVFAWVGISALGVNNSTYRWVAIVWYADGIYFGFFFYYLMVFLIASAASLWYYQKQDNSVMRGFLNLRYHLGSISFASIVITIITMLRILAQSQNSDNGALKLIACCVECILRCIEELVKVLNHNAVICMAVTGEGYIDSAKTAIGLIFDNFGVFIIVDFFVSFMEVYATIFSVLIPAVIGGGIIYSIDGTGNAITYAVWGGIIIFLLALLLSNVILGMLEEALASVFIFYSFDRKFRSMGLPVHNIPKEMKEAFGEAENNPQAEQESMQYLNGRR